LILDDIPQVIYAPVKVFKKIIENPKYLGAIIILLLFIVVQIGYGYSQISKTYIEDTSPTIGHLSNYINATATSSNGTLWSAGTGTALSNNYADFYNYSVYIPAIATNYSLFGNNSLEINSTNTNNVSATLSNAFDVNCGAGGFENFSMTLKMVEPQVAPQSAALTLYSPNDSNYYIYDLTSSLSNTTAIGLWTNLTIPVGPAAQGWTSGGTPNWGNVTALKLDFTYPANSNITILIGALFFHGQYQTFIQASGTGIIISFLEAYSLQFIFTWFILTGLIYIFFKLSKAKITWKPLFIALAFALFVMVIRSIINLVATFTLPTVYYPFDVSLGVTSNPFGALYVPAQAAVTFTAQSQAVLKNIIAKTSVFNFVVEAMFFISYVWLGALCTIIVGTLKPEFSMIKKIAISAVSIAATLLLLLLLVGIV
jgi:hypothetical protein